MNVKLEFMSPVNIREAKMHFLKLLARAAASEEIVIARRANQSPG